VGGDVIYNSNQSWWKKYSMWC